MGGSSGYYQWEREERAEPGRGETALNGIG